VSANARRSAFLTLLVAALLTLGACVTTTPAPTPSATAAALTPEAAAQLIRSTVVGAKPLLILNGVPGDWRAEVTTTANAFTATYRSGAKRITLAIAAANPPLPGTNALQSHPTFHGDAGALYQVADGRDPVSERWLLWLEPGTWSQPGPNGIPYLLSGSGITDREFWQLAESLHPNQI
jgi:hypothetical protein